MKNPLLDKDFLLKLDAIKKKKVFARIISLTKDEYPIEQIEGKVTQGSINVDGSSAVRRSCSLTLVAADLKIHNFYWGLKTKFKLEVGIENTIDPTYPEIIWFPQGMYVINSFNVSQSMTNYSISISGRDKMSLVNGELGGTIVASSHDFGTIDITDEEGNVTREDLLLKDIITYALNEFCGEPLHNIVINDLDESGIELLEYRGDNPLFILREVDSDIVVASYNKIYQNVILENPTSLEPYQKWHIDDSDTKYSFTELMEKSEELKFYFDELNSDFAGAAAHEPTMVWGDSKEKKYYVAKIEYGMTPGYRETGLTYAGDLILNAGDNVATLLERIKTMLGDFEYFYDLDGRFIFQRQRTYVNRSWNNLVESNGDVFADSVATTSAITYSFENSALIQSFSNAPVLANIKNDYAVWGTRKSVTGKELPVHVRYAIDEKPEYYKNFSGEIFITKEFDISLLENNSYNLVDWRELIYQMALDYRKNSKTIDNFEVQLAENNKLPNGHEGYYCDGKTGYEQYYTDLEGFWRGLYNTNPGPEYELIQTSKIKETFDNKNLYVKEFRPADSELDKNKKINEFYKIVDGELINYIDTINFSNMEVFVKLNSEEEKYIHPLDTLDISKKSLYIKNIEDKYIELKEYKFIVDGREEADKIKYQIYIKDGNKFLKVWDFFNVEKYYGQEIVIYPNSGEFFYIENAQGYGRHIYQDIYNKEKKDYEPVEITNVDDLINNKLLAYYLSGEEKIYIADMPIYIRRQRDIENKEWYVLTDPTASNSDYKLFVDEFLSNEKVDGKIWKGDLYIKEGEDYYNLYELIDIDKNSLYINNEDNHILYIDSVKPNDYKDLYVEDNENYQLLDNLDNNLKEIYLNEEEIQAERIIHKRDYSGKIARYNPDYQLYPISYSRQYYEYEIDAQSEKVYWTIYLNNPEMLNFWFDFLDLNGELDQYSVKAIGNRTKAVNDSSVKAIYFRETPTILFTDDIRNEEVKLKPGYTYIQVPKDMFNALFSLSSQGKSAMDVVTENLYNHAYCQENITINSIPIYYLEPNTRIFVRDDNSHINGEYIISKFSIPLSYNGMMNITAHKAVQRIN